MHNKKLVTIGIAYALVVLIWSTTPLTIKWSGQGVHYLFGITARMTIGTILAVLLTIWQYRRFPRDCKSMQVYVTVGLAIYGAMLPVYWGAQYIPSGLISVIFGLTPIVTAWLAAQFLQEQRFGFNKMLGAGLGVAGLVIIFIRQIKFGEHAVWGLGAVLIAVVIHSLSAVLIKKINARLPALIVTTGGLLVALPMLWLTYVLIAPALPPILPTRALLAIVYLGVMGSVVGFVAYYFLLEHLPTSSTALITLMTPVLAVWLGNWLNDEQSGVAVWTGTLLVLSGLILHQWGIKPVARLSHLIVRR
jgi:drug/metabolite transporter (DMT)-like permease